MILQLWQTIAKLEEPSAADPSDIVMAAATSNVSRLRFVDMLIIAILIIGSVTCTGQVLP